MYNILHTEPPSKLNTLQPDKITYRHFGKRQIWECAQVNFGGTRRKCNGFCMKQCAWRKHGLCDTCLVEACAPTWIYAFECCHDFRLKCHLTRSFWHVSQGGEQKGGLRICLQYSVSPRLWTGNPTVTQVLHSF